MVVLYLDNVKLTAVAGTLPKGQNGVGVIARFKKGLSPWSLGFFPARW